MCQLRELGVHEKHLKLNTGETEHLWKPIDRRGPTGVRVGQVWLYMP